MARVIECWLRFWTSSNPSAIDLAGGLGFGRRVQPNGFCTQVAIAYFVARALHVVRKEPV